MSIAVQMMPSSQNHVIKRYKGLRGRKERKEIPDIPVPRE